MVMACPFRTVALTINVQRAWPVPWDAVRATSQPTQKCMERPVTTPAGALRSKARYECGHESRGKTYAQHLARGRRRDRRRHRPDLAATPLCHNPARNVAGCGAGDRLHAGA